MAWVSSVLSNYELGDKLGLRCKYYGHDWEEPTHVVPPKPQGLLDNMNRAVKGENLQRSDFPEASYIFSEKHFESNVKDFFWVSGFIAVKGKLARILQNFNFGEGGGLIPYPIYQKDKITPHEGEFFLLNFGRGCQKDTFLIEHSNKAEFNPLFTMERHGRETWTTYSKNGDDFALSEGALNGPDLWFEKKINGCFFVSDRLAKVLNEARLNVDFRLSKCRIVGGENKE